jgi:hypothetical protein
VFVILLVVSKFLVMKAKHTVATGRDFTRKIGTVYTKIWFIRGNKSPKTPENSQKLIKTAYKNLQLNISLILKVFAKIESPYYQPESLKRLMFFLKYNNALW